MEKYIPAIAALFISALGFLLIWALDVDIDLLCVVIGFLSGCAYQELRGCE